MKYIITRWQQAVRVEYGYWTQSNVSYYPLMLLNSFPQEHAGCLNELGAQSYLGLQLQDATRLRVRKAFLAVQSKTLPIGVCARFFEEEVPPRISRGYEVGAEIMDGFS